MSGQFNPFLYSAVLNIKKSKFDLYPRVLEHQDILMKKLKMLYSFGGFALKGLGFTSSGVQVLSEYLPTVVPGKWHYNAIVSLPGEHGHAGDPGVLVLTAGGGGQCLSLREGGLPYCTSPSRLQVGMSPALQLYRFNQ